MLVFGKKAAIFAAMMFITATFVLVPASSDDVSDTSEASTLPTLDVCSTVDNRSLSGRGAILDVAVLDVTTDNDSDEIVYSLKSGSALVAGSSFLIIRGDSRPVFSLTGHMFGNNPYLEKTGLRFELYPDQYCSGKAVLSVELTDKNERIFGDGLHSGIRYYIKVSVLTTQNFDEGPRLGGIGFDLTVYTTSDYNALYFDDGDGNIIAEQLVKNGDRYSLPEVTREGMTFIGWYTSPEHDVLVRDTDKVSLGGDSTLYAFWRNGGEEEAHYTTPGGATIDIVTKVDNGVKIDIHAESADGKLIVDLQGLDASAVSLDVILKTILSEDHRAFTLDDAKNAVDMYSIISSWMQSNGLKPVANVNADGDGAVMAHADSVLMLAENGFGFESETSNGAKIRLDSGALAYLAASCGNTSMEDSVITIINREALDSDLTESQITARGDDLAWFFAVTVNDVLVEEFPQGRITLNIPFGPLKNYQHAEVSMLNKDGTSADVESSYSDGAVTLETNTLSVYLVKAAGSPDEGVPLEQIAMFAVASVGVAAFLGLVRIMRIHHKH